MAGDTDTSSHMGAHMAHGDDEVPASPYDEDALDTDGALQDEDEPVDGDAYAATDEGPSEASYVRDVPPRPTPRGRTQAPYQRPSAPRHTMPPVNDLAEDDAEAQTSYTHDSSYANTSFNPIASIDYRRTQQSLTKAKQDLKYGQYLEVPKGRRDIFTGKERSRRIRSVVSLVVVVAILGLVAYLIWRLFGMIF
jgi:hypothetical protein